MGPATPMVSLSLPALSLKALDQKFILLHAQHRANQAAMEEMVKNERMLPISNA